MIAFNGFMQAFAGFKPAFGDNTVSNGNRIQGLPDTDDAILPFEDAVDSFLESVQKLMDSSAPAGVGGESVVALENTGRESDMPALDQLQTLIAEGMDQTPAAQHVSQTLNAESLDEGQKPVPHEIMKVFIAHNDGSNPADNHALKALSVVQETIGEKKNSSAVGQAQPAANDQPHQTNLSGIATQIGQGDGNPIKENPFTLDIKENTTIEGLEKEKTHTPFKSVAGASDEGKYSTNRFIQERLPSEVGISKKAIEPVLPHQHPNAGQAKDPESMVTALTDDKGKYNTNPFNQERLPSEVGISEKAIEPVPAHQRPTSGQAKDSASMATVLADEKSASSEDDTANYQGKDKHGRTQRIALADVNENELQKNQSSDSVKSTAPEYAKSHPAFPDTAKAMAADPSTNMAVKQTAGQSTPLTRTEESAARTFQTTVIDQIVDKAAMRSIHGRSEIQIRLKPEFLGNVQMNIAMDKEQLVVRIVTDQPMVKEIIETHLHHLKTELHNQGLTIDKFDVVVNPDADQQHNREQFAQMFKNNPFQNGRRQPREQNPEKWNGGDGNESDDDQPNRDGVNYFA